MIRDGSGIVCLCLTGRSAARRWNCPHGRREQQPVRHRLTVSIEAKTGVTTGVSAADRVRTIQVACDPVASRPTWPGPVTSSPARQGRRPARAPGHTEGAIDLIRLAGLPSRPPLVELMPDGRMAKGRRRTPAQRERTWWCSASPTWSGLTRWTPARQSFRSWPPAAWTGWPSRRGPPCLVICTDEAGHMGLTGPAAPALGR